ncbi:MAG: hypothetical protein JW829_20320 [Pirellulales bacterium]|nr:hypothetical protein [Pirellulales bacterium]
MFFHSMDPRKRQSDQQNDGDRESLDRPALGWLDRFLAPLMWFAGLASLICTAGALQDLRTGTIGSIGHAICWSGILTLWFLFPIEWGLHILAGSLYRWYHLIYCIAPPLRLGGKDHTKWRWIWLPWFGWQSVDRELISRIEKVFGGPMICIALMILPLLAAEWFWSRIIDETPWLRFMLDTAMSVIWLAFAFELIIMISITRQKIVYCIRHWIDIAIVILPFIAFMRAFRLLQLGRVEYVGRALRVYRVRGMAMRAYRAILMLNIVRHLAQLNPEKRLAILRERLADQQYAIRATEREIAELEERLAMERMENLTENTRCQSMMEIDDS